MDYANLNSFNLLSLKPLPFRVFIFLLNLTLVFTKTENLILINLEKLNNVYHMPYAR